MVILATAVLSIAIHAYISHVYTSTLGIKATAGTCNHNFVKSYAWNHFSPQTVRNQCLRITSYALVAIIRYQVDQFCNFQVTFATKY